MNIIHTFWFAELTFVWVKFVRARYRFQSIDIIEIGASVWFSVTQEIPIFWTRVFIAFIMSVLSKYFQEAMASATCRDIVHPYTDSCFQAARGYFFKVSFENLHWNLKIKLFLWYWIRFLHLRKSLFLR